MLEEIEKTEVVEEAEVDEVEEVVDEKGEKKEVAPVNAELAELKGQVKTLTEMLQNQAKTPKPAPKPKPVYSDEQIEDMEDGQKVFAKQVNIMANEISDMKQKMAGVEDSAADGDFKREVSTFIDSHTELKAPEIQAKFKAIINDVLYEGEVTPFLQAVYSHLVGKKPAKKKPAMVSGKPKTVAGSLVRSKVEPLNYEQAKQKAREEGLAILRKR